MKNRKMREKKVGQGQRYRHVHRIYLIVALVLGISFSVFLPFFNEPDGVYHYVEASNIAGLSNAPAHYGEEMPWLGYQFQTQVPTYRNGTHFQEYFVKKVERVPIHSLPRCNYLPSVFSFNFWDHLVPAIGVWIGYHIYPSLGVMEVAGRLFTMLFCTLVMFFIIKYVKRGKLFFAAVALCPLILNTFASLSYDATTFVVAAAIVALSINILVNQKIWRRDWIFMICLTLFGLIGGLKTNVMLVLLLFPVVILELVWQRHKEQLKKWVKRFWIPALLLAIIVAAGLFIVLARSYGGGREVIYKFFINIVFNFNAPNALNITSMLVQPQSFFNMPVWLTVVWFGLLIILLVDDEKIKVSWIAAGGALLIFALNMFAVYLSFMNYPQTISKYGYILGMQGRYFTPFFLLAPICVETGKFKVTFHKEGVIMAITFGIAILSAAMLIFNVFFGIFTGAGNTWQW